MHGFTPIHRRPAKALVLIVSVASLMASSALGAPTHSGNNGSRPNDRPGPVGPTLLNTSGGRFVTGMYGAPPAISAGGIPNVDSSARETGLPGGTSFTI